MALGFCHFPYGFVCVEDRTQGFAPASLGHSATPLLFLNLTIHKLCQTPAPLLTNTFTTSFHAFVVALLNLIVFAVTKKNFTVSTPLKEIPLPTISSNHSCSGRSGASGAATTFVSLCAQQFSPVQKTWCLTALLPILWPLQSFCPFSM